MESPTNNPNICTISFSAEAHDTAAGYYSQIKGLTATVFPSSGEPFDAAIGDLIVGDDDGQYKLKVHPWDEDASKGDRTKTQTLDIYDDIDRIEII